MVLRSFIEIGSSPWNRTWLLFWLMNLEQDASLWIIESFFLELATTEKFFDIVVLYWVRCYPDLHRLDFRLFSSFSTFLGENRKASSLRGDWLYSWRLFAKRWSLTILCWFTGSWTWTLEALSREEVTRGVLDCYWKLMISENWEFQADCGAIWKGIWEMMRFSLEIFLETAGIFCWGWLLNARLGFFIMN